MYVKPNRLIDFLVAGEALESLMPFRRGTGRFASLVASRSSSVDI
jgi:hypothetical protein